MVITLKIIIFNQYFTLKWLLLLQISQFVMGFKKFILSSVYQIIKVKNYESGINVQEYKSIGLSKIIEL